MNVPKKYKSIDFAVTAGMVTEAQRYRRWKAVGCRGGTRVAARRAGQIINDGALTPSTWRRLRAYFIRHDTTRNSAAYRRPSRQGCPSPLRVADAGWGGTDGWRRAEKIVRQMNAADLATEIDVKIALLRFAVEMSPREVQELASDSTQPIIDTVQPKVSRLLEDTVENVLSALEDEWPDVTAVRIDAAIDAAIAENAAQWAEIQTDLNEVYIRGSVDFVAATDGVAELGISFDLANPRAVSYLREETVQRISAIDDNTKRIIDGLVSEAVENGDSYGTLASRLRATDGFDNQLFSRDALGHDRADRIAIFEVGDRYEGAKLEYAQQIQDAGVQMQVMWLTVGDDRVRQTHTDSQGEDWQPLGHDFISGSQRPPTDSNCRCVLLYRLAP